VSFTVTATQGGASSDGMQLTVAVVTGASASQPGTLAGAIQTAASLAITPAHTGSLVFGALLGLDSTWTPLASTTNLNNSDNDGLWYEHFYSSATTTAATPVTLGSNPPGVNSISISLAEIITSSSLAIDASSPASAYAEATAVTTAAFTPPGASLLVAMVSSNGSSGTTTMALTDSSGLGLTWTEQQKENGSSAGYSGVWTAQLGSATNAPAGLPASSGAVTAAAGAVQLGMTIQGH
jgi:hypothetical protein